MNLCKVGYRNKTLHVITNTLNSAVTVIEAGGLGKALAHPSCPLTPRSWKMLVKLHQKSSFYKFLLQPH